MTGRNTRAEADKLIADAIKEHERSKTDRRLRGINEKHASKFVGMLWVNGEPKLLDDQTYRHLCDPDADSGISIELLNNTVEKVKGVKG